MRIILKGAVFLLSLILCFIIIARIAAAPAKEKPVEDTYNDASSTVSISPIETVLEPSPPDEEPEQVEEEWPYPISQEEIELIALVTMAEAEGETELGQRLVIDTILNRVDDSHFPDNITDVIFQPNQFTSMWNGRVDRLLCERRTCRACKGRAAGTDELRMRIFHRRRIQRLRCSDVPGMLPLFFKLRLKGAFIMKALFSYVFSTMAGLCLISGIAILSGGKE